MVGNHYQSNLSVHWDELEFLLLLAQISVGIHAFLNREGGWKDAGPR